MSRIILGKSWESQPKNISLDLDLLLRTRMLIQANSGGGKSYLLRRLAEQLFGKVPVLIVDPEGEFATLREKYGYVLAGKGGETPADPRSAGLLAQRLLELQASAVCDLYEMKLSDRHRWVRTFLEAVIDAPKKLWRPTVVVVDEAHTFCMDPETEILTSSGWRGITEVEVGDRVVAFDPTSELYREEPIRRIIVQNHSGPMVGLTSDGIDALVTPDHRVVLRRMQRAQYQGRKESVKKRRPKYLTLYPWTFCHASSVPHHAYIPIGGGPDGPGLARLSTDLSRLLGWVITDGSFVGSCGGKYLRYLSISQSTATLKAGRRMIAEMQSLLSRFGSHSVYSRPERESVRPDRTVRHSQSKEFYLGERLSRLVMGWLGPDIHRIPRVILSQGSKHQLRALYQGLLEGDGTSYMGRWTTFYPGKNEGLADDFQELATRLGISTTKRFVWSIGQWRVLISKRRHHYVRKPNSHVYSGIVWDITVPSGAFVARRRGKVFVTGNSPEKGHGESEAADAMIGLATRGRKRGFAAVFATQRLGKLRKDVAAELLNVLIGQTFIDIDRKRAAEALGIPPNEQRRFFDQIKVMEPGTFWALGRAVAIERVLLKVGSVETTHPEPGSTKHAAAPPPPPEKVKALLPKLQDLPKEAEDKARTVAEFRAEIGQLKRELAAAKHTATTVPPLQREPQIRVKEVRVPMLKKGDVGRIEKAIAFLAKVTDRMARAQQVVVTELGLMRDAFKKEAVKPYTISVPPPTKPILDQRSLHFKQHVRNVVEGARQPLRIGDDFHPRTVAGSLPRGEQISLTAVAQYPEGVDRQQLSILTGYKRSSRDSYVQRLKDRGLVGVRGNRIMATDEGLLALGSDFEPLPTGEALRDYWIQKLPQGEKAVLQVLLKAYPDSVDRDAICEMTQYRRSSRDAYLQRLRARQLVSDDGPRRVKASPLLFD